MAANQKKPLRISVDEAKKRADQGRVTFLDVVDPGAYEKIDYRIKGAVRIDPSDFAEAYSQLPKEHEILAYCT